MRERARSMVKIYVHIYSAWSMFGWIRATRDRRAHTHTGVCACGGFARSPKGSTSTVYITLRYFQANRGESTVANKNGRHKRVAESCLAALIETPKLLGAALSRQTAFSNPTGCWNVFSLIQINIIPKFSVRFKLTKEVVYIFMEKNKSCCLKISLMSLNYKFSF